MFELLYLRSFKLINLSDKICTFDNCTKNAYYNLPNKKERLYCRNHADLNTMIDITHKDILCIEENCGVQASYNFDYEDNNN